MARKKKLDPFLIHELLHGAHLTQALLNAVGDSEAYDVVWDRYPIARNAFEKAEQALYDFYKEVAQINE